MLALNCRITPRSIAGGPCHAELRVQRQAAACEECLSGDVGSLVRCEKCEYRRDLFGRARTSHGNVAFHFRAGFRIIDPRVIDGSHNSAGSNRVDANASVRVFERKRFREILEAALTDRIRQIFGLRE